MSNNLDYELQKNGHHSLPSPEEVTENGETRKSHTIMQTIAGVAGNVLEWYDFAVFGYFSDIISQVFFPPNQAGHAALAESFAVFGGAFLMRPVGGIMLGYIGDIYGRKRALELSIFLMAFPTFAMGLLPSYAQIGWPAIVLLVLVRLLQGLSVGGQLMSSLVFTVEGRPKEHWGLFGSYVMAAANFGTLLGGIVGYVMRAWLNEEQLLSWGWRVPFLSGILVSLSGVYLKYYCEEEESPHQKKQQDANNGEPPQNPIWIAFSPQYRRALISCTMVPMLWSGGFYLTFVWMAIFMNDLVDPPVPNAFAVNSTSLLLSVCLVFPFAGILSDKYGRKAVMNVGGVGMAFCSPFMIACIGYGNAYAAFFAQCTLGLILSLWGAPMMAWLVESFPPEARLTAVSIGYNLSHALVGGTTPFVATVMVDKYGIQSPGYILTVCAIIATIGLHIAPKQNHNELSVDGNNMDEDVGVSLSEKTSTNVGNANYKPPLV